MFPPKPQDSFKKQEMAKRVNIPERPSEVVTEALLDLAVRSLRPPPEWFWWSGVWRDRTRKEEV